MEASVVCGLGEEGADILKRRWELGIRYRVWISFEAQ
jgi:hypothetical protein